MAPGLFATWRINWQYALVASIRRANLDGSGVEDLVMEASSRPRSIALDVSGGKLYWTDNGTNSIGRANLDGSGAEDFVTGLSSYATGIALDPTGGMIYWIDDDADRIQRANLDGTGVEDIVMSGLAWPHGLAVDPSTKNCIGPTDAEERSRAPISTAPVWKMSSPAELWTNPTRSLWI